MSSLDALRVDFDGQKLACRSRATETMSTQRKNVLVFHVVAAPERGGRVCGRCETAGLIAHLDGPAGCPYAGYFGSASALQWLGCRAKKSRRRLARRAISGPFPAIRPPLDGVRQNRNEKQAKKKRVCIVSFYGRKTATGLAGQPIGAPMAGGSAGFLSRLSERRDREREREKTNQTE